MTPKTDKEVRNLFEKNLETTVNFALFQMYYDGHSQAESELLPIIKQKDERIRELEGIIERASGVMYDKKLFDDEMLSAIQSILSEAKKGGE